MRSRCPRVFRPRVVRSCVRVFTLRKMFVTVAIGAFVVAAVVVVVVDVVVVHCVFSF